MLNQHAFILKLIDQLKTGGRMVLPVGGVGSQKFTSIEKLPDGKLKHKTLLAVTYVPLTDEKFQRKLA